MKLYIFKTDIEGDSDINYCDVVETTIILANNEREADTLIIALYKKVTHIKCHTLVKSFTLEELSSMKKGIIY